MSLSNVYNDQLNNTTGFWNTDSFSITAGKPAFVFIWTSKGAAEAQTATSHSIGGACIVLDTKDVNVINSVASFHKKIKNAPIKMSFPSEGLEIKVPGQIVWTQKVTFRGGKTLSLGVQFQNLSPKLSGMLFVFADDAGIK